MDTGMSGPSLSTEEKRIKGPTIVCAKDVREEESMETSLVQKLCEVRPEF